MTIYEPAEDSYLMSETLKDYLKDKTRKIKILDMGSGSGIQALTCRNLGFENILTADINPESVNILKKKTFESIRSNLFSNIDIRGNKKSIFDLIIFNPPYLPEDNREPDDSKVQTTGGKKGYELIIKFLKQAKSHLSSNGDILLLFSSLSKPNIIKKQAKKLKLDYKKLSEKKLFFERLYVYKFYNVN